MVPLAGPTATLLEALGLTKVGKQLGLYSSSSSSTGSPRKMVKKADSHNALVSSNDIILMGINLTQRPRWQQLCLCAGGFFFGYIVNGLCEEYVYNRLGFSYGWYFTFVQGFVYIALIMGNGFRPKHVVNPWSAYVKLSAVLMISVGLTKGSLAYLNYPAQIMFKSTKVIPVMIMGAFIPGLRRTYNLQEYVSALMLVVGLIVFTLADASSSPNFHFLGVVMVCGALVLDSILGNLQEAIFKMNSNTSQIEMLFCSTIVGMPFLVVPMLLNGELWAAWDDGVKHPYIYGVLVFEALATYVGQLSVLALIALFGAATTAMVTTLRKVFTLLLSYIIFTKPLLGQHVMGLLFISMGIGMKMIPNQIAMPSIKKAPSFVGAVQANGYKPVSSEERARAPARAPEMESEETV